MEMRKAITTFVICAILGYTIYTKDIFVTHIVILFFICFYDLIKGFYYTGTLRLLNFKNFFLINYFYIHGLGYFSYKVREAIGINIFDLKESLILHAIQVSIIAVLVLLFAYNLTVKNKRKLTVKRLDNIIEKYNRIRLSKWLRITIAALFLFLYMWYLMSAIPFLTPGFHSTGKSEVGAGLGLMETICLSLLNSTLLFYIWFFIRNKKVDKTFVIFFALNSFLMVMNDSRGALMGYILSIAIIYYFLIKPFTIKQYVAGLIMLILIAGAFGAHRGGSLGDGAGLASIGVELQGGTAVEFDNYVETFEMFEHQDYLHGSTLVPVFTLLIPRFINPDKNKFLTAGEYFKHYHNHDYISVGERLTYIGELYMNWGYMGIVLGMLLLGFLMAKIQNHFGKISSVVGYYFYVQLIISTSWLIPGDIASVVPGFLITNIVVILYAVLKKNHI